MMETFPDLGSLSDSELKELIHREDPSAFIAIENLHEVANGNQRVEKGVRKTRLEKLIASFRRQEGVRLSPYTRSHAIARKWLGQASS